MRPRPTLKQIWTFLVLFAVIMPVTIVMIREGRDTYYNQLNNALKIESQANEILKVQIELEIKRLKTSLINKSDPLVTMIGADAAHPIARKEMYSMLRLIVERESSISGVIILSKEGKVIAAVDPHIGVLGDHQLSIEELQPVVVHWGFENIAESPEIVIPSMGRDYISSPVFPHSQGSDEITMHIAIPIAHPVTAILIAEINIKNLWSDYDARKHGIGIESTKDYILDSRGSLLTEIDDSPHKPGDLMTHLRIARNALINEERASDTSYIGVIGQPVFGTTTPIPSLDWTLVSEVIVTKITHPIMMKQLGTVAFDLIIVLIFVSGVLFLTSKTLRPIKQISDAIERVAGGDYQFTLGHSGILELDAMADGFNHMAEARKNAETALTEREKRLAITLDNIADGIVTIDETGTILSFNKTAEAMFGYAANEVIGENVNRLMPSPYTENHDGYLRRYLDTGKKNIIGMTRELEGLRQDNTLFPIRLSIAEIPGEVRGKRNFIASCQDLTLLKQQDEQLRRSQKMDALGKLTGGVAHDYNNLLAIVLGYSGLLKNKLTENPELTGYIEEIRHAGERGAKLTEKLLDFSRKQSSDEESLSVNELLQAQHDMLEKTLTVRIKLILDLTEDLWPIWIDSGDLEDAIINMSINAMHAMDGGGQLTIRTRNGHVDTSYAQALQLEPGDYVLLSLTDTGCGMDEATKEKLFDPFYSTKGEQGTGLGLSQVYGFVERSGGAIKIYSELGHGSQFVLYFPRYEDHEHVDEKQDSTTDLEDYSGIESILVLDDEEALLRLNAETLSQNGYNVTTAESAKQALQILGEQHIDLLLSDVIMPEMDGYQLAAIVQEKYPDLKIQLLSGFTDKRHSDIVDKSLHRDLLYKPCDAQTLLKRIRALLDSSDIHSLSK